MRRRGSTEKGVRLAVFVLWGESCWCESSRRPCLRRLPRMSFIRPIRPAGILACSGLHWTLRRSRPWFESGSGYCCDALRVWRMHDCLRSSRARFNSSVGYFWCAITNAFVRESRSRVERGTITLSLECGGCTRLCEGRRPGSTLMWLTT